MKRMPNHTFSSENIRDWLSGFKKNNWLLNITAQYSGTSTYNSVLTKLSA